MQIDIYSTDNEAQLYQNMVLAGKTLDDLAGFLDDAMGLLQRRTKETSWFCGKILCKAKSECKHGQWIPWLKARNIAQSTAKRYMALFNGYPQIAQIGRFGSMDEALKALAPPKPEPKQIEQPEPTRTDLGEVASVKIDPDPNAPDPTPKVAIDTTTGQEAEFPQDRQPTAAEQIQAHDNAPKAVQDVKLTKQDVLKNQVDTEPRKPQVKTMQRNMRFSKEQNGTEVLEHLYLTDYVVISARDLWRLLRGYPLQGVNGKQVVFQKGQVLR